MSIVRRPANVHACDFIEIAILIMFCMHTYTLLRTALRPSFWDYFDFHVNARMKNPLQFNVRSITRECSNERANKIQWANQIDADVDATSQLLHKTRTKWSEEGAQWKSEIEKRK